jgi:N-acetylmuramoyl-L-alanine amidase
VKTVAFNRVCGVVVLLAALIPRAAADELPAGTTDQVETPAPPPPAVTKTVVPQPLAGKIIVLDPGHAVLDARGRNINPGSRARRGVWERDVVLDVADKLVPLLEAQGAKVFMTRTRSNPWRYTFQSKQADNRARAIFANTMRADAYVRLHCDWNRSRKYKGFTTFYYRWGSRRLALALHKGLDQAIPGRTDHGVKRRTFVSVTTVMPAVLVELGVLSNKKEGADLAGDGYKARLAEGISKGLVNYFENS